MLFRSVGYMSMFKVRDRVDKQSVYDFLLSLEDSGVYVFSPLFYFMENPKKIQNSVNMLLLVSVILLTLIYVVILRNSQLLLNTLITLSSSILVALAVVGLVWSEVSIFVLAFGVAVSSIGVDYMFHHYFHNHYCKKQPFNFSVFWGFTTTVSLFALFLFVDFMLIRQFSLFGIVCLTVSYLI